jgi:hypothetical protein
MSISVVTLPEKQPSEIVPFTINLDPINVFADGTEAIASVAWSIYDDSDTPGAFTDIPSMKAGDSFLGTYITCRTSGGTDGYTYIIRALVTCNSGNIYEVEGRFRVKEVG